MNSTLIVTDAKETELCSCIARIFGPSKLVAPQDFDGSFKDHESAVIVFSPVCGQVQPEMKRFMEDYAGQLKEKRIALLCIAANKAETAQILQECEARFGNGTIISDFIEVTCEDGEIQTANDIFAEKLIQLKRRLNDRADMPENLLTEQIDDILRSHNTCTLCTGFGTHIRATPIEYLYENGMLYFMSEGGEKFANLSVNPCVSIAVYNAYSGFGSLESIQIEGKANILETFSEEYMDIMKRKGLDSRKLRALPVPLNMFRVLPERYEVLKSDFAKNGYRAKQVK